MLNIRRNHLRITHRVACVLGVAVALMMVVVAVRFRLSGDPGHHATAVHAHCHHHGATSPADHDHKGEISKADTAEACVVVRSGNGPVLVTLFTTLLPLSVAADVKSAWPAQVLALASVDHAWPHGCGPPAV